MTGDVNEREEDLNAFSGGVFEQGSEGTNNLGKRSPPSFPFAVGGRPRESLALSYNGRMLDC